MVELRKLSQASLATVSNTVCFHIWPKCWSCRCWEEAKRFFSPEAPAVSAMVENDVAGESGGEPVVEVSEVVAETAWMISCLTISAALRGLLSRR